jgi:WhiB family transcriptional regulator, redox-sensing transcriptional regulator
MVGTHAAGEAVEVVCVSAVELSVVAGGRSDQGETIYGFALCDVPQPGPWVRHGACRTAPSSVFFPSRGDSTDQAKAICRNCPVRVDCLEYALDAGERLQGVWGATSAKERRQMRLALQTAAEVERVLETVVIPLERRASSESGDLLAKLEQLTQYPGRWAVVGRWPAAHSAPAIASLLRHGHRPSPPGRWSFEARTEMDGGSALYACFDGALAEDTEQ